MALFRNPKAVVYIIVFFILLFIAGLIFNKAHAENGPVDAPYAQVSGGAAIIRGPTEILDLTFTEPAPQVHGAFWQESLTVIGTSTYNGQSVGNNMALRGLFIDGFGYFDVGLGAAYILEPAPYNGSNLNFNLQLDYRFTFLPITATYTHMSNAGITAHNLGRDIVLIGWRFH